MKSKRLLFPLWAVLCLFAMSCGGDDDDDDPLNLTGNWRFTLRHVSNNCGAPATDPETFDVSIQQTGNQYLLTDAEGGQLSGTVNGNTMTLNGTIETVQQGCTVSITYNGTGQGQGNQDRVTGTVQGTLTVLPGGSCIISGTCGINFSWEMVRL